MKSLVTVTLLLGAAILLTSCAHLTVSSPPALQTSSQDFKIVNGHIVITVKFSRPVDMNTVVVGKSFILQTAKDPNAGGTLQWSGTQQVTFTTAKTAAELLVFQPDGRFTLKLIGKDTGNGAIKDVNGQYLDGNSDKVDGDDYTTSFTLLG